MKNSPGSAQPSEGSDRLLERCQCIKVTTTETTFRRAVAILDEILHRTQETTGNYPFEFLTKELISTIFVYPYGFSDGATDQWLFVNSPTVQSLSRRLLEEGFEIEFIEKVY